ncbi:hypothetical protein ACFQW6_15525 [Nocardioides sp. GCM10028917]|uniref:hypothetical protein n=1 Tax=Nocardioides sp. GCM10028917 TaxID=3273408 RepID=UPI00360A2658
MTRGAVVAMVCVLLAGCGADDGQVPGDEPITPAAIAAIVQEHVDLEPRRIAESMVLAPELGERSTAAWLEYGDDVSLTVVVAPTSNGPLVCAEPSFFDECVDDSIDGHEVTIAWQQLEPEEDPGVVYVIDRREGEDALVKVSGASITDDPRDLDLGVPLADLAALVVDPRLSLTTSQTVVEQGASVDIEQGGPYETPAPR